MPTVLRIGAALLASVATLAATAVSAEAALQITNFTGAVQQADGSPATQAGSHPYSATTTIEFATHPSGFFAYPDESVKNVQVTLPPGFVGDPTATPRCTEKDLNNFGRTGRAGCPDSTQVGIALVNQGGGYTAAGTYGVYNIVPPKGVPGAFAFVVASNVVRLVASVRTGDDYGLTFDVNNIAQFIPVSGTRFTFWGTPADHSHDLLRGSCANTITPGLDPATGLPCMSDAPVKPFLTNPVDCSAGPLPTGLRTDSWETPGVFATATFDHDVDGVPLQVEGCDRVPFDPAIVIHPNSRVAHASTGLSVQLRVPQDASPSPSGIVQSTLRKAVVTLPQGMAVSPSAADGLGGCAPDQIGIHNANDPVCPDSSKIGTVDIETPLLERPLEGSVYLATQNDNPFNSLLALYIVAQGSGVTVKLPGRVDPDPVTGQLTATFDNNPELPFSELKLDFDGGARAPLVNPPTCGVKTTTSELTGWSGKTVTLTDSFTIDQNCDAAGRFEPSLSAGVLNTGAGSSSPFTMTLSRPDGQQAFGTVDVALPAGLVGRVADVPLCPEPQAAAGTCSAASQIGMTTIAAGAGSTPLWVAQPGKAPTAVYLAGPYKGAPFSLSIVVPAQAGPFDLGTVVVRAALFIDPLDAHVTVKSDPLPTILMGVPLDVRTINVTIDRPRFMIAPTNCAATSVAADVRSSAGAVASVSNRFQVGDCAELKLEPKLSLALTGKAQTTDNKHPGVVASLKQTLGQSNLKKVTVTLPLSLALDTDNAASDGLCSFVEGSKPDPQCPKSSIVGTATATTPILGEPLTGPVFFTKNERKDPKTGRSIKTLPKLVIPLKGNGVSLTLTGTSAVPDGKHLVTTFDALPDAPVSDFRLNITGGKKGILVVSHANLCVATQVAVQEVDGQNGKTADDDIVMSTPCTFGVAASSHTATALKVTVGGIGAGRVSVSGKGLTKATKSITSATAATLAPRLSKAMRRSLARGRDVKVRVTVSFTPKGAKKARKITKRLVIHGAKKK